jgi:hypothetical protein
MAHLARRVEPEGAVSVPGKPGGGKGHGRAGAPLPPAASTSGPSRTGSEAGRHG